MTSLYSIGAERQGTTAAITLESLGADMIGANCSLGPDQLLPVIAKMVAATSLPVTLRPNAGMPVLQPDGRTTFPLSPEQLRAPKRKIPTQHGPNFVALRK